MERIGDQGFIIHDFTGDSAEESQWEDTNGDFYEEPKYHITTIRGDMDETLVPDKYMPSSKSKNPVFSSDACVTNNDLIDINFGKDTLSKEGICKNPHILIKDVNYETHKRTSAFDVSNGSNIGSSISEPCAPALKENGNHNLNIRDLHSPHAGDYCKPEDKMMLSSTKKSKKSSGYLILRSGGKTIKARVSTSSITSVGKYNTLKAKRKLNRKLGLNNSSEDNLLKNIEGIYGSNEESQQHLRAIPEGSTDDFELILVMSGQRELERDQTDDRWVKKLSRSKCRPSNTMIDASCKNAAGMRKTFGASPRPSKDIAYKRPVPERIKAEVSVQNLCVRDDIRSKTPLQNNVLPQQRPRFLNSYSNLCKRDRAPSPHKPGNCKNSFESNDEEMYSYMSSNDPQKQQSFLSEYSTSTDFSPYHKPKISEEEMWEVFQKIFKRYASTNRHSGGVISEKLSTEWMINAGIVGELFSEKETRRLFRETASTKVTLNTSEFKNFLILMARKKKLPYYEIYRRMCGL